MSHGGDDEIPEEHEEHVNHEAWVIPYADLLTLLMAMFIALFAISTVDTGKFQALARGFSNALGGGHLDAGIGGTGKATSPVVGSGNGYGPFSGGTLMPSNAQVNSRQLAQILSALVSNKQQQIEQRQTLQDVQNEITRAAQSLGLAGKVQTKQLNNGLEVTLLTDQILFDPGKADVRPDGALLLGVIGKVLTTIDNPIDIYGFTDSSGVSHYSNVPVDARYVLLIREPVEDAAIAGGIGAPAVARRAAVYAPLIAQATSVSGSSALAMGRPRDSAGPRPSSRMSGL